MTDDDDVARATREVTMLVQTTVQEVFSVALTATAGRREPAQDLVQEVYYAAWKSWHKIAERSVEDQRAWLFLTLQYKAIDRYRRTRHETITDPGDLEALVHRRQSDPPVDTSVQFAAALQRCWLAIKAMPKIRGQVIWMRAHEWKTAEIADQLGIAQSTVRAHYRAGVQELNSSLGPGWWLLTDADDDDAFEDGVA